MCCTVQRCSIPWTYLCSFDINVLQETIAFSNMFGHIPTPPLNRFWGLSQPLTIPTPHLLGTKEYINFPVQRVLDLGKLILKERIKNMRKTEEGEIGNIILQVNCVLIVYL